MPSSAYQHIGTYRSLLLARLPTMYRRVLLLHMSQLDACNTNVFYKLWPGLMSAYNLLQ